MTAPRELRMSDIRKMMDDCAPGYDIRLARHSERWRLGDKSLFLPKTNRGRLEVGYHVRRRTRASVNSAVG